LENLQKEFSLQAQALVTSSNSVPFPQQDPPTHKQNFCSLFFGCAREYSRATHALAPFSLTPTYFNTTLSLIALHLNSNGYFPFFLKDYKLDQDLELSSNFFKLTFQCMPHLLVNGPFMMVFEHPQN